MASLAMNTSPKVFLFAKSMKNTTELPILLMLMCCTTVQIDVQNGKW